MKCFSKTVNGSYGCIRLSVLKISRVAKISVILKTSLTHLRSMFPSNRNLSLNLHWKQIDCFYLMLAGTLYGLVH